MLRDFGRAFISCVTLTLYRDRLLVSANQSGKEEMLGKVIVEKLFSGISLAGQASSTVTTFERFGNGLIQIYLVFVYFLVFKFFQV